MDDVNNKAGDPSHGPLALSWDTLPELAKNRWEEAVAFDVTIENQLAKAKADRSLAESERQRIAKEILDATKDVCKEIITDGKRALNRAKTMEAEAQNKHSDSQAELEQARAIRAEAEGYRDKIIAEAYQEARDFLDQARSVTEKECLELREQATQEAKRILGQVEIMRAAVQEELETQKIYSDAARIKANSHELLSKLREMTSDDESPSELILEEDPSEEESPSIEVALEQEAGTQEEPEGALEREAGTQEEPPIVEGSLDAEYGPELEVPGLDAPVLDIPALDSEEGQNGKKLSRRSSARK